MEVESRKRWAGEGRAEEAVLGAGAGLAGGV